VLLDPVLVGRSESKLRDLCQKHDVKRWTTDLGAALRDPANVIYFDAQVTTARVEAITQAIEAGKHVYAEKPIAESLDEAVALARLAGAAGVKNGVVQDKLFLPGLLKLKRLIDGGFFGRILSVRGEFGYWVFEGDWQSAQRPSWNYRAEDGGGITLDMFCHWSYVLENLFGRVEAVTARVATHIPQRTDEAGRPYTATADDAAYGIFELSDGVIAQVNSSWCVRVNRDELVEFQVDGTNGSAVAGLRGCRIQHRATTPSRCGTPTCPSPTRSGTTGNRCRTTTSSTTASRPSGSCSSGTSWRTRRSPTTFSPGRAVSSSSSSACARPRRASASNCRRSTCDRAANSRSGRMTARDVPSGRPASIPTPLPGDPRLARLSLNQWTTRRWGVAEAVEGCARAGVPAIGLWREQVAEYGLTASAKLVRDAGGLPDQSRDLAGARSRVADALAELEPHAGAAGVRLAIDFRPLYEAVNAAGYDGDIEVEIFNAEVWAADGHDVLATMTRRYITEVL
jgi:predicted dehydrogenase